MTIKTLVEKQRIVAKEKKTEPQNKERVIVTKENVFTRGEIMNIVLSGIGLAGALTAAVFCPNLLQLIPKEFLHPRTSYPIKRALLRLDKKGWIVARETNQGWKIRLTKKGQAELRAYELGEKKILKPRRWDRKWRLLVFDIPEKRKQMRDTVRRWLRSLGFRRLQDSIWVHPFECREVLDLLRTRYGVRGEALYLCAEPFENDRWLKKEFGLS